MGRRAASTRVLRSLAVGALTTGALVGVTGCAQSAVPGSASAPEPTGTLSGAAGPSLQATPTSPSGGPSRATTSRHVPAAAVPVSKVLVVIEENHSLTQMRSQMPFLAGLADRYGYATNWKALTHPSEPNYLAIVGGSMFGVTNDRPPADNAAKVGDAPSVFSQAREAGKTAATYAEAMPVNCALTDAGDYAVRHNPWAYFAADRAACLRDDVSTESFVADARANRLPNVGFLIPGLVNDAHDAPLSTADDWLQDMLEPVTSSRDFTSGRLVVIVTADEDDRHWDNTVLTAVLTPRLHHKVVSDPLTHYSLTRYLAQVLGVTPLGAGQTAPDLASAFGL